MAETPDTHLNMVQSRSLLGWYVLIRLLVVCFFVSGTIVYHNTIEAWAPPSLDYWLSPSLTTYLYVVVGVTFLVTFVSFSLFNRVERLDLFVHAQLTGDLLLSTWILYLTGGVDSLYSFLYILVIIASSVFCNKYQVMIVASAAAILYGSLLDLQYYGILPQFGGKPYPPEILDIEVFYTVFIHVGAFLLTALLSSALAERLKKSEQARQQRESDYGDLANLNQAILANINSGLMIINPEGRIRSFNNAASKITGYRFRDVYNRPAEVFFDAFSKIDLPDFTPVERGESAYRNKHGDELTLGYSATRVQDSRGVNLGMLVAFQDLTEYKTLEEQFKRADKLAAVGRLASGMAHEIRNPLASISGSVQLMLENEGITKDDRRLMEIVVKEADRLSLLLSDFLTFARPLPLKPELVDLNALINELLDLVQASGQFESVVFERDYRSSDQMVIDRQKMRQALWDLILNAVEAACPGGRVRICVRRGEGVITIEDSGPGIKEQDRDKLFEPFFTTKDRGTGLGLANVHANVEAHDGRIFVEPSEMGGARFIIELPVDLEISPEQESVNVV